MLQRDHQSQRMILHDVVITNEKETMQSAETTPSTTEVSETSDSLYTANILQKAISVNNYYMPKVIQFVLDFVHWLREKLSGNKELTFELQRLESKYEALLKESQKAFEQNSGEIKKSTDEGGEVYSIGYTSSNNPVLVVNDDVLRNVYSKKDLIKTVKMSLGKFKRVPIKGQTIYFISDTKNEFINSKYSRWLKNNDREVYHDKMRIAGHPQDIVYATTDYINEGLKHKRKDNIVDFARGNILIDVSGRKYTAEVVIGFTKSGICELHDILNMQTTTFEYKKEATSESIDSYESTRNDVTSNNKIAHNEPSVNNYSMQDSKKYSMPSEADTDYTAEINALDEQFKNRSRPV